MTNKNNNKGTALVLAGAMMLGLCTGPAAQPVAAQSANDASIIISFCKTAHNRFMRGDKGAYLNNGMAGLEEKNRPVVALACAAYGVGYQTGQRNLT